MNRLRRGYYRIRNSKRHLKVLNVVRGSKTTMVIYRSRRECLYMPVEEFKKLVSSGKYIYAGLQIRFPKIPHSISSPNYDHDKDHDAYLDRE